MKERWYLQTKKADFNEISRKFNISPILARLLRNRNVIGDENIKKYLSPDIERLSSPWMFKDMEKAVDILKIKIAAGNRIRVICDYDVDGVCSGYILYRSLKKLGAVVDVVVPHRIEDGYGINLLPLATFAMEAYADDPCEFFGPKTDPQNNPYNNKTLRLMGQMHKAISIIQFKLEADIIRRRPEFHMEDRLLLHHIDFEKKKFILDGQEYEMRDCFFPTIDPADPYRLTEEEAEIVQKLHYSFTRSEKLRKHMKCLFRYGCMFNVCNSNLLFHASMPLNEDGTLKEVEILGRKYKGKELLNRTGQLIRTAYFADEDNDEKAFALDYIWYLWCGKDSPAFDKSKMATFERYFLVDKSTHKEVKGAYYTLRDREDICDMILDEFGVEGEHRHIINGHVPVKAVKGEKPIKANGKLMVIDGGFSRAYQPETGIAGYTLVYHSRGFQLVQHEPFTSTQKAIEEGQDIKSTTQIVELSSKRMMVKDTDKGRELSIQIEDLKKLLVAYRTGIIKEKAS